MKLFEHTRSTWVRYNKYEWKDAADGLRYLTPAPGAKPGVYDPLEQMEEIVLDAVRIGRRCMNQDATDTELQAAFLSFAEKYGLFGLMTALPTTADFMDYEAVYLPKNRFIKDECMAVDDYLDFFFPFEKLDYSKRGVETTWSVQGDNDMMALFFAMSDEPIAVSMGFQRAYAERYDWLKLLFTDWALNMMTSFFYYTDYEHLNAETKRFMQKSVTAFGGNAPTYYIALLEKPTLIWNFHSLLLGIQMMFSFMMTDETKPLRICKKCANPFIATRPSAVFCSPRCKNQYNVYKSRAKKKDNADDEEDDDLD